MTRFEHDDHGDLERRLRAALQAKAEQVTDADLDRDREEQLQSTVRETPAAHSGRGRRVLAGAGALAAAAAVAVVVVLSTHSDDSRHTVGALPQQHSTSSAGGSGPATSSTTTSSSSSSRSIRSTAVTTTSSSTQTGADQQTTTQTSASSQTTSTTHRTPDGLSGPSRPLNSTLLPTDPASSAPTTDPGDSTSSSTSTHFPRATGYSRRATADPRPLPPRLPGDLPQSAPLDDRTYYGPVPLADIDFGALRMVGMPSDAAWVVVSQDAQSLTVRLTSDPQAVTDYWSTTLPSQHWQAEGGSWHVDDTPYAISPIDSTGAFTVTW